MKTSPPTYVGTGEIATALGMTHDRFRKAAKKHGIQPDAILTNQRHDTPLYFEDRADELKWLRVEVSRTAAPAAAQPPQNPDDGTKDYLFRQPSPLAGFAVADVDKRVDEAVTAIAARLQRRPKRKRRCK